MPRICASIYSGDHLSQTDPPEPPVPRRLFRQEALTALTSPDQLTQPIEVTSARSWAMLVALVLLLGAAIGWGVFGRVSTIVSARGVLVRPSDLAVDPAPSNDRLALVLYLPIDTAARVHPGMAAQVRPLSGVTDAASYARGVVRAVGSAPATRTEMTRTLGNDALVRYFAQLGLVREVDVALPPDGNDNQAYSRSSGREVKVSLRPGSLCDVTIITGEQPPLQVGAGRLERQP